MDRCTGCRDITEILFKTVLNTIQSIIEISQGKNQWTLPHNKILASSNLKEFADDKIKVVQMMKFVLDWFENDVGKEENAVY